jgi:hypothetical protein
VKITFRITLTPDAGEAIARDPALAAQLDLAAVVIELDHDDERFHRLLEVTRRTSGAWLNPYMTFTAAEQAAAKYLQLQCRGKILNETPKDSEQNREIVDGLGFQPVRGRLLTIKLVDRLAITKMPLAPNAIGCATHWTPEFIVPRAVADVFTGEGLTGFELKPVLDAKAGRPHPDFFLLYSASIMPEAGRDQTTIDQRETDAGGWRELGALTYDLAGAAKIQDFNRTAENWSSNHLPFWIVSQRVREVMAKRRFKGWGYLPVLEKGSPLHREYTRMWAEALERVSANPRNHF